MLHVGFEDFGISIIWMWCGVVRVCPKAGVSGVCQQQSDTLLELLEQSFLFTCFRPASLLSCLANSLGVCHQAIIFLSCLRHPNGRKRHLLFFYGVREALPRLQVGGLGDLAGTRLLYSGQDGREGLRIIP